MRGKAKVLTDISKIKWNPRGSELQRHWDAQQPGLCVTVYPSPADGRQTGRRAFYVRYTDLEGKQRFQKLGDWPEIDLEQARSRAAEIRTKVKMGLPAQSTKHETVNDVWRLITTSEQCPYRRYARNTKINTQATFDNHITFKSLPVLMLTEEHWLAAIDAANDSGKTGAAKAIKSLAGTFYKNLNALPAYRQLKNPLAGIHVYMQPSKRKNALTLEQIKSMSLNDPLLNAIMQMLISTGQRISEVLRMRWDNIREDVIVIGELGEMKRKDSAHHLPLTPRMRAILEPMRDMDATWCFPGRKKHISAGYFSAALHSAYPGVTPHVFRHTFATICADKDLDAYGVSLVLHHSIPGQTHTTYIHSQHIERKRAVLEAFQRLLTTES